jgi:hypothetical protein
LWREQPSQRLKDLVRNHPSLRWTTETIRFSLRLSHEPIIHRDIKPRNSEFPTYILRS